MARPARDPYEGLLGPVAEAHGVVPRRMFGCWAYYVEERLVWVSAAGREPWRGILVPTERSHHAALRHELPALRGHPVLGKWLYLAARHRAFEATADRLALLVAAGDPRIGVLPLRRSRPRARARVKRLTAVNLTSSGTAAKDRGSGARARGARSGIGGSHGRRTGVQEQCP